jgi:lysophospholipase L1-like esterase
MLVHFETDSRIIAARWQLRNAEALAMDHMPANGVSGLDLYFKHESLGWRFLGVGRVNEADQTSQLVSMTERQMRPCRLHLPLYNGLKKLEIGVQEDATFRPVPPCAEPPIVYYGTSITQGGCASRPGMAYTNIVARRIDRPGVNLGFSGNGRMDPEVIDLVCELEACLFVLDPVANMGGENVIENNMASGIRKLHEAHPETPILLAENPVYDLPLRLTGLRDPRATRNAQTREVFEECVAEGIPNLHYLPAQRLMGTDCEGACDGSHPTDLGFMRMADGFETAIRRILDS